MSDFLGQVTLETQKRVQALKSQQPQAELRKRCEKGEPLRSLTKALRRPNEIRLIAELKQASPSAGVIRKEDHLEARLAAYERGGASALSILTEENYFHGSPQLLDLARRVTGLPLLRKDFVIDPYQIFESKSLGADAVLLIVAILSAAQLQELLHAASEVGLETLVEIHDEKELEQAWAAGARLLGINNRNLHTLQVDVSTAARILPRVPKDGATIVVESGIKQPGELAGLRKSGAHAVLIGETLMRHPEPETIVRQFVEAGRK